MSEQYSNQENIKPPPPPPPSSSSIHHHLRPYYQQNQLKPSSILQENLSSPNDSSPSSSFWGNPYSSSSKMSSQPPSSSSSSSLLLSSLKSKNSQNNSILDNLNYELDDQNSSSTLNLSIGSSNVTNQDEFFLSKSLKGFINSGLMNFSSTAMVMPFEVGKTLLQVQFCPKKDGNSNRFGSNNVDDDGYDGVDDEYFDEDDQLEEGLAEKVDENDDIKTYFTENRPRPSIGTYSSRSTSNPNNRPRHSNSSSRSNTNNQKKSPKGLIINSRPEYVLPVKITTGVTDMMRAICQWRGEGFLSLWKGQLTTFMIDSLSSTIQPTIQSILNFCFNPNYHNHYRRFSSTRLNSHEPLTMISIPIQHQAYPTLPLSLSVGSYLITGLILSPLDLIRTRMIVQSSQLRYKTYSSPWNCLKKILKHEGGLRSIYFDSNLFFPAFLDNLIRPVLQLCIPLIIDRWIGIERSDELVKYSLIELGLNSLGLLIILPIETIRKRLQIQKRLVTQEQPLRANLRPKPHKIHHHNHNEQRLKTIEDEETDMNEIREVVVEEGEEDRFLKSCVEIRKRNYNGIVEGFYRIVTEEKFGLMGLYRGFKVGLMANVVVFVLSLIGNQTYESNGWTEL